MDTIENSWSRYAPVRGQGYVLAQGSCFDLVKALPDASVDLICVDPPYTQGSSAPFDPKVCSYENVAWSEAEWRAILQEGTRVLRKGGKQLIFCSNTLRRELEPLVDSVRTLKMDCPYVWERGGNFRTCADRVSIRYREPALEFVLVIQQKHELAASSMAESARNASRILGQFGRPEDGSVKHPDLYRELLGRYQPGVVLDYCMHKGACGVQALQLGHTFLGVELRPDIFNEALARFGESSGQAIENPSVLPLRQANVPKRKAEAPMTCGICLDRRVDKRPCMGGKCTRCGTYYRRHQEDWHPGVKMGRPKKNE